MAGTDVAGFANGAATVAQFNGPAGIAVDGAGNLYVGDVYNHRIRKLTPWGVASTVAGSGIGGFADGALVSEMFNYPYSGGIGVDSVGNLYIGDYNNHRIRVVTP